MNAYDWLLLSMLLNASAFIALWVARMARNELRETLRKTEISRQVLNSENMDLSEEVHRLRGTLASLCPDGAAVYEVRRISKQEDQLKAYIERVIRNAGGC